MQENLNKGLKENKRIKFHFMAQRGILSPPSNDKKYKLKQIICI